MVSLCMIWLFDSSKITHICFYFKLKRNYGQIDFNLLFNFGSYIFDITNLAPIGS